MEIPVDVDDITPAWLGAVLDAPVIGVEVLDASSGTTGRARLQLAYAGGPGKARGAPESVFVKLQPFDERQRAFLRRVGIGVSEARFYRALGAAPDTAGMSAEAGPPVRIPGVLHVDHDDADGFVMVLEDLVASGCTFPSPRHADVAARAVSTVEEMARLHARFWESPRFDAGGDLAWAPTRAGHGASPDAPGSRDEGATIVARVGEHLGDHLTPAAQRLAELYAARTREILDLFDAGERTLIHGDAHMGNLFNDGARTGFLDWAMVAHAPGPRDVAYYCCSSLPAEVRREIEHDLLAFYRTLLATGGVFCSGDGLLDEYRMFSVTAWVACATTALMGSRWQSSRVGLGGLARANAAIEDLDAVGYLEERLA